MNMPVVPLTELRAELEPDEFAIVRRIVAKQGINKGKLRASKPYVDNTADPLSGQAAYVWRMVAFMVSDDPRHGSMPVTAEWDLPVPHGDERKVMVEYLNKIVDIVCKALPLGISAVAWAKGFGLA